MVIPAFAQDNFPDVPDNHWAYEALANLKKAGVLVGYPDGLFRGGRPASRYELAVAINAAYTRLSTLAAGLQSQIDALKGDKMDLSGYAKKEDLQNLRDALSALQNDVNAMKGWGDDIANLKRLADTFQKELQGLGVDVEAMKKDLGDLADRVTKLENRKPAVDISGDANLWLGAGNARDDFYGMDMDGRINGTTRPNSPFTTGAPTGLTKDLTILHELGLTLAGTNDTGPKWHGTLVVGNMLGGIGGEGFGNQSTLFPGNNQGFGYGEGPADVYLQDFSVRFDTSVAGLAFNAEVGRVGYKVSPYIYQRIDKTSYFSNERWDNGLYYFDGGILGFNFGGAKLDVFGGRTSNTTVDGRTAVSSVNGTPVDPLVSGPIFGQFTPGGARLSFDRQVGANLNVPLSTAGNLNLAYLILETNDTAAASLNANRLNVFGGSADWSFGRIKLEGGYSKTNLTYNSTNVLDNDNTAWNAKIGYNGDKWGLWGGYREVEANYLAPGDWGRLGVERNPTNIKGFQVGGHLDVSNALTIKAMGEFDKGKSDTYQFTSGFNEGTKIDKFAVDLGYRLNSNFDVHLGYEDTKFKGMTTPGGRVTNFGANEPHYRWTTIGFGYGLSDAAKLSFQYQISDIENEFYITDGGRFKGGFLTTQLSVKF
ncbi:S-layer domain protein [Fimbriimonas ginsengisoli Gsoil 348]|uniref:S-layer domain protein n=2 Tax=Fimbriimonas ginsengisoli TaxID=1005039 RepID=A0A068NUB2_FIMGI|nr:S-layer domain protein [Fimbriimonas ginsengisoli Gsoil 348]